MWSLIWKTACIMAVLGIPTKIKMKNTCPKKIVRYIHQIFYFVLLYINFYISRYHFSHIFRTSLIKKKKKNWKNFFSTDSLKPPCPHPMHPFNSLNLLSMMRVFVNAHLFSLVTNFQMLLMVLKYMIIYFCKVSYLYVIP